MHFSHIQPALLWQPRLLAIHNQSVVCLKGETVQGCAWCVSDWCKPLKFTTGESERPNLSKMLQWMMELNHSLHHETSTRVGEKRCQSSTFATYLLFSLRSHLSCFGIFLWVTLNSHNKRTRTRTQFISHRQFSYSHIKDLWALITAAWLHEIIEIH